MDNPIVSIIVPIYNSEQYLCRCIDSILAQTYNRYELILVDDGSTDNSGMICRNYVKQDERICYYKKQNGGVSEARNFGIQHASQKSSFICFVDSDDYVDCSYLEHLVAAIGDAQLSMCRFKDLYDNRQPSLNQQLISVIEYQDIRHNNRFVERFQSGILNSPCNKLYRLAIIRECGIFFPQEAVIAEDLIFNLHYLRHSSSVNEVKNALYFYCHRDGSLVSKIKPEAYEAYFDIRNDMIDYWGGQFELLIDMMIYRQLESISIKLVEQGKCKVVKSYVSQTRFQDVLSHVHLTRWNDRLIHYLLQRKQIWLMKCFLDIVP